MDIEFVENHQSTYFFITRLFEVIAVILSFGVLILCMKKLNAYEKKLLDNFSEIENKTLKWLKNILAVVFVLWLL